MKKLSYWLAVILLSLIASLNPIQAARLVPGTAPEQAPLQPLPSDTAPNYSGSIDFNSEEDKANQPGETSGDTDEPANAEGEAQTNLPAVGTQAVVSTGSQLAMIFFAVLVAGILSWLYYRYRAKKLSIKKPL